MLISDILIKKDQGIIRLIKKFSARFVHFSSGIFHKILLVFKYLNNEGIMVYICNQKYQATLSKKIDISKKIQYLIHKESTH